MIISEQKPFEELSDSLKKYSKIFLIGCGECATACKTGGKEQLEEFKVKLESAGKTVLGIAVPESTCVASKLKAETAKNLKAIREAEAIVVFSCGLGVQSVKDNDRFQIDILPGCNSLCAAVMDNQGNFFEKCSMCADCVLDSTGGICPVTLCPKGILNGPCGGMDKGKCELDKERDCAWVLIYKELEKKGRLQDLQKIKPARNFKKSLKPHKVLLNK